MTTESDSGWIYILSDQRGFYKIGKAARLDERVKQVRLQLPYKVELVAAIRVKDRHQAERDIHNYLADYRANGEWFELPENLIWLWETFPRFDSSFALQNCFLVNSTGRIVPAQWSLLEGDTSKEFHSPMLFYHFENLCLDQACADFNLPLAESARKLLAPIL